ncbi:hypothetical protein R6Q57_019622 [Mikania cordata]
MDGQDKPTSHNEAHITYVAKGPSCQPRLHRKPLTTDRVQNPSHSPIDDIWICRDGTITNALGCGQRNGKQSLSSIVTVDPREKITAGGGSSSKEVVSLKNSDEGTRVLTAVSHTH